MEIDYISIGMRVRKFRRQKGLSQEKLSEMTGLTPAHFSHIETGNTNVSLPSLVKIACALEVSLDDLMVDSLTQTRNVSIREMNLLLADCSDKECRALLRIMEAGKEAIRQVR